MHLTGLSWNTCAGAAALLACLLCPAPAAAQAAPGDGRAPQRPNLLVIVTDDQRPETFSVMRRTRELFERASTNYPNAHVSTPLCCPSRSTIFSGLYAHNHGVFTNDPGDIPNQQRTVQRWLQLAGYRTGLVGKYLNSWPSGATPPFWDEFAINEGAHRDAQWNVGGRLVHVPGYATNHAARRAASFIADGEADDSRPWFLYVATSEPHGPLEPRDRHASLDFGGLEVTPAIAEDDLSDKPAYLREQAEDFAAADGTTPRDARLGQLRLLQGVDEMIGLIARNLRRRGELGETLVLFVSDNGLHWGEHGGFVIKDLPYDASTHVPLRIRWPRPLAAKRPKRDARLVSNVDIAPTLLDLAGVEQAHKPDGRSLRNLGWTRERLLLEYGGFRGHGFFIPPWIALRSAEELYVEYGPHGPYAAEAEYYDLGADQWEVQSSPSEAPAVFPALVREAFRCRGPRSCP